MNGIVHNFNVSSKFNSMKKYLFTGLILMMHLSLFSQIKIGITAGLNFPYQHIKTTSPSGNVETTRDMIVSFNAGIASDFKLSKKINVQPVLQLSGKGSTFSYMIGGGNEEINVKTSFPDESPPERPQPK